jgi:RNA polymerase sigma factor (sigma-70 family)
MVHYSNEEIIAGFRRNDSVIISAVYKETYLIVDRFMRKNGGGKNDVKDIMQDAMLVFFDKSKSENFILTSSFNTYIYSVCRFLWLQELDRRRKDMQIMYTAESEAQPESEDQETEMLKEELFRQHFGELSLDCQKILFLHFEKKTIAELTQIMGYSSEQHTLDRKYRCKKSLIYRIFTNKKYKLLDHEVYNYNRQVY